MNFQTLSLILLIFYTSLAFGQDIGKPLPTWQEGMLDIHHINTGRGDAAFAILPDGTTFLIDAGEMNPTSPRTLSPRNAPLHPNYTKMPYEWIAQYIRKFSPDTENPVIDYALITHFHDDHFGSYYPGAKLSASGDYYLTGIAGVGDLIPIKKMIDRGYPYYNCPFDMKSEEVKKKAEADPEEANYYKSIENYWNFLESQKKKGMRPELLRAGKSDQIVLVHEPASYPDFKVRNVKANGTTWTGKGEETIELFPTPTPSAMPGENPLSLVIRIDYGPFRYYTGGDIPGIVDPGQPDWQDVETPVAKAVGEVDVAVMDHHGNRDAHNNFNVSTLRPRVWIEEVWSSDHPGHEVLRRITSQVLYPGPRDLFATNMLEANKIVIGPSLENAYKSTEGHIVLRVMPGGTNYYVIILNDNNEENEVTKVFGPYETKPKSAAMN